MCRRQIKNKGFKSRLLSLFAPSHIFFVAMCIVDHAGLYPINEKIPWKVSDSRSPSQVDTYKYLLFTLGSSLLERRKEEIAFEKGLMTGSNKQKREKED